MREQQLVNVISERINIDRLVMDIDQQIEILTAIAQDNAILTEQLRLLHESRETIASLQHEIFRLEEMLDPDQNQDGLSIVEKLNENGDL